MKNVLIAVFLVLCAVAVGLAGYTLGEKSLGAASGPDHYVKNVFYDGLETAYVVNGNAGVETLSASAATTTLTAAQLCSGKVISWAPTTNNATATLPTTASLVAKCLPKLGMFLDVQFRNAHATTTYNVVAGTGQTLFWGMTGGSTSTPGTTITSSTPAWYRLRITLVSSTDSTASLFLTKFTK